jgi:hypothetical protein
VDAMALKPLDPEVVRRWVERWCEAQGVAVKVTGRQAVERAATLLREGRRPTSAGPPPPHDSRDGEAA